ncbi:MAG TPA: isochorismatase family protein [bacterium]|jgi:nicotinamidase-related amidase|nr:isochorismatase family protein [bacterium]
MKIIAAVGLVVIAALILAPAGLGQAVRTIVDEWASVVPPPPPQLRPITVDPRTTALLVLDILNTACNRDRRPRCVASVPRLAVLINRANQRGMFVVYSITNPPTTVDNILPLIRPIGGEPVVAANADKFLGTNLEQILRDRGIRTVIVTGTAAHGAVLYTASAAALRGFQVVVPVDLMSAETLYIEQYVAFNLANAPTIGTRVTLTRSDLISF